MNSPAFPIAVVVAPRARFGALTWASTESATLLAAGAFFATYVAVSVLPIPRLFLLPLEDRFIFTAHPPLGAMGYLGLVAWATIIAASTFAVALSFGIRVGAKSRAAFAALAVTTAVAALATFAWLDWPWQS